MAGRPTKLTDKFLKVADEVINQDINAIILTDEEMLLLINEKLEEKARICDATLENWKAGKFGKADNGPAFLGLIKKALIRQKRGLFEKLGSDDKAWPRWCWIIERKFDEWNIKHKEEHSGGQRFIVETRINGEDNDN